MPHAPTPSTSAYAALNSLPTEQSVLITTADHALLSSEVVDYFCRAALRTKCDLAFALSRAETVTAAHPDLRRTVLKLRDGGYCSCNLFAFMTPRSRQAADYWRQVEQQRKRPWKIAQTLGWPTVLRYGLGRLSLNDVLRLASQQLKLTVGAVVLPFPQAAIDVDTVADWEYVNAVIESARATDNASTTNEPRSDEEAE